jgi:VWFA-related protein
MYWILRGWRWFVLALVACAPIAPPAWAEGPGLAVQRVDASQFPILRIYTSVANGAGMPITGLDAQAFQVQEDGKPVDGIAVEPIVDSQEPIAIALVIDTSGSMADESKLDHAKKAASSFVDALGPADRMTIVNFSDQVTVAQDYSTDRAALKSSIDGLAAQGNTLLYDAVAQTAHRQAGQSERRKALILLTDGQDTKSASSLENSITAATSAGSPVYAIGLGSDVSKDVLDQLASATGGQAVYLDDSSQLLGAFRSIGDQLRRQYVLRYTSRLLPDSRAHGLAIQVTYSGQSVNGLGSFTTPAAPPDWTVSGLTVAGAVTGVQHVAVDVPGGVQLVQLLVDDQVRATTPTAPYTFDWDVAHESVGSHHVIVRVTDAQGVSFDKAFSITVGAVPTAAPPQATPAPVATAPTTVTPPSSIEDRIDGGLIVRLVLLFLLVMIGLAVLYLLVLRRGDRTAATVVPVLKAPPPTDMTELVGGTTALADMTSVRPRGPGSTTQARLLITRGGEEREVLLHQSEATVGRDDSIEVPIKDPQASRKHARIFRKDGQFWVEDLGSLNGTHLNGEPITSHQLVTKDRIGIGETVLTFVVESH